MKNIALSGNSSWSILNFRKNLIIRLISEGYHVHILAPLDASSRQLINLGCIFHEIKINRIGLNPFRDIFLVLNYFKLLKKLKIDYVCSFNIKPNLYIAYACYFLPTKQIMNISGLGSAFLGSGFISLVAKLLYKAALLRFSKRTVFFQNLDDLNLFKKNRILNGDIDNVLPGSGIDLSNFYLNNNHLSKGEPKKIIFVGRLIKDKGIKEFLIAAKKIVALNQDVNFLIYGEIDEHNPSSLSHEELKEMLHHQIRHMGNIPDIRIALKESHCVVLPSYREGMSRSLLEAAASGIPIITTNVPGCREIVEHTKNGYLCNVRDSGDLANKIFNFLKLSSFEIKIMGDAGRLKIEKEFSDEIVINKYLKKIQ